MSKNNILTKEENEDLLSQALNSIAPGIDDFVERRINHINFARIVFWMCIQSRKSSLFYSKELRKFMKMDDSRVHQILKNFIDNGLLKKDYLSNNQIAYCFISKEGIPVISKYFEKAKKTLGVELSLSFKKVEEDYSYF
jgi:hypothetical protein